MHTVEMGRSFRAIREREARMRNKLPYTRVVIIKEAIVNLIYELSYHSVSGMYDGQKDSIIMWFVTEIGNYVGLYVFVRMRWFWVPILQLVDALTPARAVKAKVVAPALQEVPAVLGPDDSTHGEQVVNDADPTILFRSPFRDEGSLVAVEGEEELVVVDIDGDAEVTLDDVTVGDHPIARTGTG